MSSKARTQSCSSCGDRLLVPYHARTIRCTRCRSLSSVHSFFPSLVFPKVLMNNNSYNSYSSSQRYNYDRITTQQSSIRGMEGDWPDSFPKVTGKKRALLIGISYSSKRYELKGTVNDVNCMKYFLVNHFKFPDDSFLILTEEEKDPHRIPTRRNILKAMQWLISGVSSGNSLFFHFSGHGSQRPCLGGDENDGFDETLCPLDYETEGMIVDDDINNILVRPLPTGVRLHAIVDSCHSGTVLDLPYLCKLSRTGSFQWEDQSNSSNTYKGTSGGLAISFSGCGDHQTSADTAALSNDVTTGAMTFCFIQAVISEPGLTYGRILSAMRTAIRDAGMGAPFSGPIAALFKKVFKCGIDQEPQLASSEKFDIHRMPFIL
ncbi:metacaspase-1-like [Dioscorea cayenensis subsp. rotundata]|uniref:Metacaspase-1-like n=1 Tax=Dioscorea cayennensis subsp. rotundata TaxID=55577 RepID=A0AB40BEC3_DIOCR|nr:metacaspase-1-like [Dioscorea cayenensis subsp. rotundata]